MSRFRAFLFRLRGLLRVRRLESELSDELRAHLDGLIERNLAAGMSLEEARYAAGRAFGGVAQIQERARDERRCAWVEHMLHDFRYAARQIRQHPGLSTVVVLTLALGIGANTAVFSLVNAVLLRQLPVKNPDELVLFSWAADEHAGPAGLSGSTLKDPATGLLTSTSFSGYTFQHFRERTDLFTNVFAFAPVRGELIVVDGSSETSPLAQAVSGNYHAALGVKAVAGRLLTEEDDQSAASPVVVISFHYWQARFGGDLACLGRLIRVRDTIFTIVGITAPGFNGTMQVGDVVDLTFPLAFNNRVGGGNRNLMDHGDWWLRIMARLKPGVTADQARAAIDGLFHETARGGLTKPRSIAGRTVAGQPPQLRVESGAQGLVESRRRYAESLRLVFALVVGVLLVACANIANLLLARGAARRREIAVRLALGAGRARIVRQLLVETLLLAFLGGATGAVLAIWGRAVLLALQLFGDRPLELDARLDARVLGFTTVVALVTGTVCGLAPALRATRVDLVTEFQGGPRSLGAGTRSLLARTLMVGQVGLSIVLLVGAGLLVRTLRNLHMADFGFRRSDVLLFTGGIVPSRASSIPAVTRYEQMSARLRLAPGVQDATFSFRTPLEDGSWQAMMIVPGYVPAAEGDDLVKLNRVDPRFFATFEMPLLMGRVFGERDDASAPLVAIVNETLARKIFGKENAVGRVFKWYGSGGRLVEVVGVVRDAHYNSVRNAPPATAFVPFRQVPGDGEVNFAVRLASQLESDVVIALRRSVGEMARQIDPQMAIRDVRTQDEQIARLFGQERLFARLSGFFALIALGLAGVGLYGLMSFSVLQRTGEIGMRVALGALPRQIAIMVLGETFRLVLVGAMLGIGTALAATRLLSRLLYDVSPVDAATYMAVTALLSAVALLAVFLPAHRASKIDPTVALRAK